MKKYNTPDFDILTIASADVITASPFAREEGDGADWDWSKQPGVVSMQDGGLR